MRPTHGRLAGMAFAIVAAMATLVGCSGAADGDSPRASTHAPSSPSATNGSRPGGLALKDEVLPGIDAHVWNLAAWGHYVAWGGASKLFAPPVFATVYDVTTRKARHVATAPRGGQIQWVRGDSNTVIYVSSVAEPRADGTSDIRWTINATDLATSETIVLARDQDAASRAFEPSPTISYPWVVWSTPDGPRTSGITALNLRTGQRRTLARGLSLTDVQVAGDQVYYLGASRGNGQDAYSLPLSGGKPIRLTLSAQVGRISVGGQGIAYFEPVEGEATSVWFMPHGQKPRQLLDGEGSNMVAGDGFVAWLHGSGAQIRSTEPMATAPIGLGDDVSVVSRLAASGSQVVFAEDVMDAERRLVEERVHLVRVTPTI